MRAKESKELLLLKGVKELLLLKGVEASASLHRKVNKLSSFIALKDSVEVIRRCEELKELIQDIELEHTIRLIQGE